MAVLTVGTGPGDYPTIEAAVAASASGDTVQVQSGIYTNDFITIDHDLTLEAAPGATVALVATASPPNGKAIIDEGGTGIDVTIQGFDMSGAAVSDSDGGNGAAIRYEGGNLALTGDVIHDNQEGLLGVADANGQVVIDQSTFANNGVGDPSSAGYGLTHNIYVNAIASLTVENSTITEAVVGHDIKSRAATTIITNDTITDGLTGSASYEIDLPNGGNATIENNTIEKGPNASNPVAITFGEEGGIYPGSSLIVEGNTIGSADIGASTTMVRNDASAVSAAVTNNLVAGWATLLSGLGTLLGNILGSVPCYCAGTMMLTDRGETPVEALAAGDVVVTASGARRPVRWTGQRSYAGRFLAANPALQPIRFRAGSLGAHLPHRDLLVSPDHAMFLDGVLVPARCLVNGGSIAQERGLARVDYVHIELDSHDILLAEGAPSESFIDDGSRGMFDNAAEWQQAHPGRPDAQVTFHAPRVETGAVLDAIRRRLNVAAGFAQAA